MALSLALTLMWVSLTFDLMIPLGLLALLHMHETQLLANGAMQGEERGAVTVAQVRAAESPLEDGNQAGLVCVGQVLICCYYCAA